MHNITIIDDVVNKETQDLIESKIFSPETQWVFSRTMYSDVHKELDTQRKTTLMAFTHLMIDGEKDYKVLDDNLELYKTVLPKINSLLTCRAQLQLPLATEKLYGLPHIDGYRKFPYTSAVYYVNDSDGDTFIFKERFGEVSSEDILYNRLTIHKTISPKKGRLVMFDGDVYHAVGKPKNNFRCIINYNFI